jgi:hypothetical protein
MAAKLKLGAVTPAALAVMKKHGLLDTATNRQARADVMYTIYLDANAVEEVATAIFPNEDFGKTDWSKFDLAVLSNGIQDFFLQLVPQREKSKS